METCTRSSMNEKVYKWLSNTPLSSYVCPLCDAPRGCFCYRGYESCAPINAKLGSLDLNGTGKKLRRSQLAPANRLNDNDDREKRRPINQSACNYNNNGKSILGFSLESVKWGTLSSDMFIKAENSLFPVHRAILSKHSKLLKSKLQTEKGLIVELSARACDVKTVLEYMYNFGASLDQSNVSELLIISDMLGIKSLHVQCKHYLKNSSESKFKKTRRRWRSISDIFSKF